jgi:LacI family transcriptional regulator
MKADINTIALKCGVSKSTVSRVFTGKATISDEVRKKVFEAAHELNYSPRQSIHKKTIAIVTGDIESLQSIQSFHSELISLLCYEIVRRNYQVQMIEFKDINSLKTSVPPEAAIVLYWQHDQNITFDDFNFPLITINDRMKNCHAVCTDHAKGAERATGYLLKNGFSRIGLIVNSLSSKWGDQQRIEGYKTELKKNNITLDPKLIVPINRSPLLEALIVLMNQKPDALILGSESYTLELCHALNLLNIKVPEDISVISYENIAVSRWLTPPHTTINQNLPNLTQATIDLIEQVVTEKPKKPIFKLLPNEFIERQSVRQKA